MAAGAAIESEYWMLINVIHKEDYGVPESKRL